MNAPHATSQDEWLTALFDAHAPFLLRVAERMTAPGVSVDDLVQETFLRAVKRADELRVHPEPRGWLYRTLSHIVLHEKRAFVRHARRKAALEDEPRVPAPGPDVPLEQREAAHAVRVAMQALSEAQRSAIVLVDCEGQTMRAAADMQGVPLQTLAARVRRGRGRLRDVLSEDRRATLHAIPAMAALAAPVALLRSKVVHAASTGPLVAVSAGSTAAGVALFGASGTKVALGAAALMLSVGTAAVSWSAATKPAARPSSTVVPVQPSAALATASMLQDVARDVPAVPPAHPSAAAAAPMPQHVPQHMPQDVPAKVAGRPSAAPAAGRTRQAQPAAVASAPQRQTRVTRAKLAAPRGRRLARAAVSATALRAEKAAYDHARALSAAGQKRAALDAFGAVLTAHPTGVLALSTRLQRLALADALGLSDVLWREASAILHGHRAELSAARVDQVTTVLQATAVKTGRCAALADLATTLAMPALRSGACGVRRTP